MKSRKLIASGVVVVVAVIAFTALYLNASRNPWTRDCRVYADIVQISSRVSGPVVELAIQDNQYVSQGDLLFRIDPRTYEAQLEQAEASLALTLDNYEAMVKQVEVAESQVDVAESNVSKAQNAHEQAIAKITKDKAELDRQKAMFDQRATSQKSVERAQASYDITVLSKASALEAIDQANASLEQAFANLAASKAKLGQLGDENSMIRQARAALRLAELNYEFTEVRAPVSGHVTNLSLRLGNDVAAGHPVIAVIDDSSYRINAYFQETDLDKVVPGNLATVTLMGYTDRPLDGYVESIGWGINQADGSSGPDLLPKVSPTFEWIRLAQRVPVIIRLKGDVEGVPLRVGTTASTQIHTAKLMPSGTPGIVPLDPIK